MCDSVNANGPNARLSSKIFCLNRGKSGRERESKKSFCPITSASAAAHSALQSEPFKGRFLKKKPSSIFFKKDVHL